MQEEQIREEPMGIFELSEMLDALKTEKKYLEEKVKGINEKIGKVDHELSQLMAQEEIQNFVSKGKQFYLTTKVHASPIAARKSELFSWLKDNGYESLVQETVNSNTLSAFTKELIEEHGELPEELEELINVFEKVTVGVKKAPKK